MVKASGKRKDGTAFIVPGLSRKNTELLLKGHPIHVDGREFGLAAEILLCAGETEDAIAAELQQFISGDTLVTDERGAARQ